MSKPTVSVIIPTYNRLVFLRQALDSVYQQTFTDYEVIVVDDGSSEDIQAGVNSHPVGPRIFRQTRQGPAAARNLGIRHAQADIVAFLDSDDLWAPDKLETFMRELDANPGIRIFYGPMSPIDVNGKPVPGRTKKCHDGWITEKLFCSSFVHVPSVLCYKQTLFDVGCFNDALPVCEDYDLWLRVSIHNEFRLVAEPLALRRLHDNRLSKRLMCRNLAVKAKVLQDFYDSNECSGNLSENVARARLARVHFVAGREALRGGQYRNALELCRTSRRFGCSALRSVPLVLRAGAMAAIDRNGWKADDSSRSAEDPQHSRSA